jgi:hypothetical protein
MKLDEQKIFDYHILNEFTNKYNINTNIALNDPLYIYRLLCFKMNYFMKFVNLPKIKTNSLYEAVLIEFRQFPHMEFVLRNTILKLGNEWSHTIICGNLNYPLVENFCKTISANINVIKINVDNMTQSEYSKFLTTMDFWNLLKGEKILIYQEDSIIFKNNIRDFLDYDFIGAPFPKNSDDTPNSVGNGGFSLRSKSKMIEIIKRMSPTDCNYNSSTIEYMKFVNLEFPPEDVYFSKCMQESTIGIVANWETAFNFSSESVFNPNSLGGHKFWISNDHWKTHMKQKFNFKIYKPKSDIDKFLKYNKKPDVFNLNKTIPNAFDIDLYFFCKVNNIKYINHRYALNYINKFALDGFIYHPKQLINIFPKILFYNFLDNIHIINNNNIVTVQEFLHKYLYILDFNLLSNLLIDNKYSCLNDNYDILIMVFIGNEEIGIDLIKRIIKYKEIQNNFNIAFCFNEKTIKNFSVFKNIITNNFDFYAIYKSKELGSDITPTLLMYNDIIKKHKFQHVLKFHTKTINKNYFELTNFLISVPLIDLLNQTEYKTCKCNCIGEPNYYINLKMDIFNNTLKQKHISKIDTNKSFVGGTIFYAPSVVFDTVLHFVRHNNYRCYLLNNLYENNSINNDFSPNHFLERLFGVINTKNV